MKKSELIKIRKQVKEEIEKRKLMLELIKDESVKDLLEHFGLTEEMIDISNVREILDNILANFKITETNGLFVCIKAYDEDYHAPCVYFTAPDSKYNPDIKSYKDIESGEVVTTSNIYGPTIIEFERSHTVFNPYNAAYDDKTIKENGYNEVRLDFFEESYRHGQNKAVQMILKKYPRI